ncbi:MAG: site-2 protease family protein [Bacteroidota bacterium]
MIQVAQILFILSVLVILHEFGHYITARMFKMRVEKFYLFMDIGFSLIKKKIGETEWGIGWLPLGGYVKISGMIDESMDEDQMKQEPQPWEFRSKPAWQRLIVMLGGIIVNVLLAWLIYTIMFSTVGQKYISTEKIQKNGLAFGEVGQSVGFKNGDKIVSIDGKLQPKFNWAVIDVLLSDEVVVNRNGKEVKLNLTDEQKGEILGKEGKGFVKARFELKGIYVDSISSKKSQLKFKDEILGIQNQKLTYFDEFKDYLIVNKNKQVAVSVKRDNKDTVVNVLVDKDGSIGLEKDFFVNTQPLMREVKVAEITEGSNAEVGKLNANDIIQKVNGVDVMFYSEFKNILKNNKNKEVVVTVNRNNTPQDLKILVNNEGKLGFSIKPAVEIKNDFEIVNKLSFSDAVSAAVKESYQLLVYNVKQFKLILRPATGAYKQVQSPIGIARRLPTFWDWEFIWNFTALFSIGLAFMNLLPIPGLDGGHALFTIVEMVTGKKLSDKAAGYVQTGGMIFLLSLMALTFGKDIYQLILDKLVN